MRLRGLLRVLRDRWPYLAATVLLGLVLGWVFTAMSPMRYAATTTLFLSPGEANNDPIAAYQGSLFSDQRMKSYAQLASSKRVAEDVVRQLGLSEPAGAVAGEISATAQPNTVLMTLTATDGSPQRAAQLANAAAASLVRLVPQLERPPGEGGPTPVTVQVVQPAIPDPAAVAPSRNTYLMLGGIGGLLLGLGVVAVRNALDDSIRSADGLHEASGVPVLCSIPFDRDDGTVADASATPPRTEAYRRLRTNLHHLGAGLEGGVVLVASPGREEGRTTLVGNLAMAVAAAGGRVLAVDADLRRPRLAEYLATDSRTGLTDVVAGRASLDDAVQPCPRGPLDVLPSGPVPPNPTEVVGSQQLADMLQQLRERYDLVLVDSPPLLEVADGSELAAAADGVVLACRFGHTTARELRAGAAALLAVSAHQLGSVLTMAPDRRTRASAGTQGQQIDGTGSATETPSQPGAGLRPSRRRHHAAIPEEAPRHGVPVLAARELTTAPGPAEATPAAAPAPGQSLNHHPSLHRD